MGDTGHLQFTLLCVWLICLLVATFLGYDRGRAFTGLWLGLFFGPFGVIAAGFLLPSIEVEVERERARQRRRALLQQQDDAQNRERKRTRSDIDDFLTNVEQQVAAAKSAEDTAVPPLNPAAGGAAPASAPKKPSERTLAVARLAEQLASSRECTEDGGTSGAAETNGDYVLRLRELARNLTELADGDAIHGEELRRWIRWLNMQADAAQALKRRARTRAI